MEILRIESVEVAGPHALRVTFDDGVQKRVDLLPLLEGPICEPLRDAAYFSRVLLDPVAGTVVWPNGTDFAPEALHELPDEDRPSGATSVRGRRSGRGASRR